MVVAFKKAVTELALQSPAAALQVVTDRASHIPVGALLTCEKEQIRLASVLLPVVGVDTGLFIMLRLSIWAPDRFVVEEIEISVSYELVNLINAQFLLGMGKRTELSVVAQLGLTVVALAVLCLVLVRVVKFFHSGVTVDARVACWTNFLFRNVAAEFRGVHLWRSSSVFQFFMIVGTFLEIVNNIHILAFYGFKDIQV